MPDENTELDAPSSDIQPQTGSTSGQPNEEGRIEDLPQWAQRLLKETRDEAAQRRIALREAEEARRREAERRMAEAGEWKTLAETRAAELESLTPYKERAEALEKMIRSANEQRIGRIPDEFRALVPVEYTPEKLSGWLDANLERLMKRPAPDIDAGAGGGSGGARNAQLSAEEKQAAQRFNMTEEQYANWKQRANNS